MRVVLLYIILCVLASCTRNEVNGIKIGNTLYEQQGFLVNTKFRELIKETLNQNSNALIELINFNCGGAAGCYDLGSVIIQIINRIGEDNLLKMTDKMTTTQKIDLRNFIEVGLEYGYRLNNNIGNKTIDKQFPVLDKNLPR